MSSQMRPALWFLARRIVVAGIVLGGAFGVLFIFRGMVGGVGPTGPIDWSTSIHTGRPVSAMVAEHLPTSLTVLAGGMAIAVAVATVAILLGVGFLRVTTDASSAREFISGAGQLLGIAWIAVPAFVIAIILLHVILAFDLNLRGLWAPTLALAILPAGLITRSVLGELSRSNSVSETRAATSPPLRYGLRVLAYALTMLGGWLSALLILETIFATPGIGRLFITSVMQRDYPVMFGSASLFIFLTVGARLLADALRVADLALAPSPVPVETESFLAHHHSVRTGLLALTAVVLILLPVMLTAFSAQIAPADPMVQNLPQAQAPIGTPGHPLGTDQLGRDILSRLLFAIRGNLAPAVVTLALVLPAGAIGILAGWLAGRRTHWGGVGDELVMLPMNILAAFPALALAILIVTALGPPSLMNVLLALMVAMLPASAGIVRGVRLHAPTGQGIGPLVMGNIAAAYFITGGTAILYFAGMSFLGLGMQPPTPELGSMLSEAMRHIAESPRWIAPALMLTVLMSGWWLAGELLMGWARTRQRHVWLEVSR